MSVVEANIDQLRKDADSARPLKHPGSGIIALPGDEFLRDYEPVDMALAPIIPAGQVIAMTAPPNHGKTTIAALLALATAGLVRLRGFEASPGRVLYLCGENEQNFRVQLRAAMRAHGLQDASLRGRVDVVPKRFTMIDGTDEVGELANNAGGFRLIVVDTRVAFAAVEDENDNSHAAEDARAKRVLTRAAGRPAVLDLCHPVKNATADNLLPRGGGAYLGEIDGNLTAWKSGDVVTLGHTKLRMPAFDPIRFEIVTAESGYLDSKGQPVRSVYANLLSDADADERESQAREQENRLLFAVLHNPSASMAEWALHCGWVDKNGKPEKWRVPRVAERLKSEGLLKRYRERWTLTPAGKKEAKGAG